MCGSFVMDLDQAFIPIENDEEEAVSRLADIISKHTQESL